MVSDRSLLKGDAVADDASVPTSDAPAISSEAVVAAADSTSVSPTASPVTQRKIRVTLPDGSKVINDYGADGTTLADQRVYDASGTLVLFKLFDASGRTLRATATNADGSTTTSVYASSPDDPGVLIKTFTQATDGSRTVDDYGLSGILVFNRRTYDATGNLTSFTNFLSHEQLPTIVETAGTPAAGADLVETGTFSYGLLADNVVSSVTFDPSYSDVADAFGTLVPVITEQTVHGDRGEVDWTFVVPASQVEFLAAGQSVQETFDVTLTDQNGTASVSPLPIVVTGTNDAPVPAITADDSAAGAVSDTPDAPKNTLGYYTATGTLSFTDPDLQDVHTLSSIDPDYLAPGLTSWSAQLIQDSTGGGTGRFRWTYVVSLQDLQALAPGEIATKTFQIEVTDNHGGAVDETVSITLTGTADHAINHAPILTFGTRSNSLVEAGLGVTGTASATVAVRPSDLDQGDTATLLSTGWTPVDATHLSQVGTYGSAVLDLGTRVITYTLDDARIQTDALAAGQKASDSFAVTDQDTHGLTTTKTATFLITGTNDAPTFVSGVTDPSFGAVVSIVDGYWSGPVFSPDSTKLAYTAAEPQFGQQGTGVLVTDLATGAVTRVSTAADGTPEEASAPAFSPDSNEVTFLTTASDLLPAGAAEGVVLKNLTTGAVTPLVSTDTMYTTSPGYILDYGLSPDGTKVAFNALSVDGPYGTSDIFVKDLATGVVMRVATGFIGSDLTWSPDGTKLLYETGPDLALKDFTTGAVTNFGSGSSAVFSPDGNRIAYVGTSKGSEASTVLIHDLVTGVTTSLGDPSDGKTGPSFLPDGNSIAFSSGSPDLVPNDSNATISGSAVFGEDVFIENIQTGAITRVSTTAGDVQADGDFYLPLVSPDGKTLAFGGGYSHIVPGTTQLFDLYLKNIADPLTATPTLAVTDDGSHAVVTAIGRLLFTDPDRLDSHTVTVSASIGDLGTLAAVEARDATGQLTGIIDLSYTATHSAASAALGAGQTRTDTFTVTVNDGHGGTAQQAVSVALTEAGPARAATATALAEPFPGITAIGGTHTVDVQGSGQTLTSDFFDTFRNHGEPGNTFVFDPGHGLAVVSQFRVDGTDHDTMSLLGSNFGNSIADTLRNTHNVGGSAVITDPTSGDTVRLAGVSKAELKANQGDFIFHP